MQRRKSRALSERSGARFVSYRACFRLKKLEQVRSARARRYCFHFDEVAEAEAQGLPYVLVPRELSREEWIERYSKQS